MEQNKLKQNINMNKYKQKNVWKCNSNKILMSEMWSQWKSMLNINCFHWICLDKGDNPML